MSVLDFTGSALAPAEPAALAPRQADRLLDRAKARRSAEVEYRLIAALAYPVFFIIAALSFVLPRGLRLSPRRLCGRVAPVPHAGAGGNKYSFRLHGLNRKVHRKTKRSPFVRDIPSELRGACAKKTPAARAVCSNGRKASVGGITMADNNSWSAFLTMKRKSSTHTTCRACPVRSDCCGGSHSRLDVASLDSTGRRLQGSSP